MRVIRLLIVLFALGVAAPMVATAQPPQPAQEEFVPVDQLPPEAELPAARMVIGAYIFVWVAFVAYIFTLIRRVKKVEGDLAALERTRR